MNTPIRPGDLAGPAAAYELAMHVADPGEMILTAGIVGTRPDGTIAEDVGEQAAEVWRTIGAILSDRGFTARDIVSYTTYVVAGHDLGAVMAARDQFFGRHRAASTLIPVPELAQPQWKVEVAAVAVRS